MTFYATLIYNNIDADTNLAFSALNDPSAHLRHKERGNTLRDTHKQQQVHKAN